jgi:uncharacterized protein YegP (UPF0339 family)
LSGEEAHVVGVDVYCREDGLFDWRYFAKNGEQQAESMQGYTTDVDARRGFVEFVRNLLGELTDGLVEQIRMAETIDGGDVQAAREVLGDG